jgi:hypothetical protein
MRRLRIPASVQLPLGLDDEDATASERWWSLPEESRCEVLLLLARLIARGIVCEEEGET